MAAGWRSVVFAAAIILCGTAAHAQVGVVPLVDESDPIRLSDATFDGTDPERRAITVRLENKTAQPISTDRIWLSFVRFYTPDETQRNGTIWNCGLSARANHDQPSEAVELLPGASLRVRMPLAPGCVLDPQHEHFSAAVSRITTARNSAMTEWKREPADFSRLLQAAR
jgi:hypothetical protein